MMVENKSNILTYPTQDRIQRQTIGGILFLILGLILIIFGFMISDTFWSFCGAPLVIMGLFINGYKKVVQIDQTSGNVLSYSGFYIFVRRNNYQCNSFDKIVIRKSTSLSSRFSNISNRTYESTINVSYKLFLVGNNEVEVDSSNEEELAKQWGEQISKALNLNLQFEDENEDQEKTARKMTVMKWASIIILFSALSAMIFLVYQLVTI